MARKTSVMNDSMHDGSQGTPMGAVPVPGSSTPRIEIEDLGFLDEFPSMDEIAQAPKTGQQFVVLVDILSSGYQGEGFTKGQVIYLSELFSPTTKVSKNGDEMRARIRHLIEKNAIRVAMSDEKGKDFVEVTTETESEAMRSERSKREMLEKKLRDAGIDPYGDSSSDEMDDDSFEDDDSNSTTEE